MTNRKQYVKTNNLISNPAIVKYGIYSSRNGTEILSFLIYISDMFNLPITGKFVSYADDTVVICEEDNWDSVKLLAEKGLQSVKVY